jgi:hypothetical protein
MKYTLKQTISWVALIIGIPIVINFVIGIYTPYDLYVVGNAENWLSFYGSYFGGVITAGVAYLILWHTIKENNKVALRSLKKEELYKQQEMMAEHISNFNFYSIAYISMFVSQKDMYYPEILRLNSMFDKMTILSNSFNLLYENSIDKNLVAYKVKYKECVVLMRDDINDMIKLIYKLQSEDKFTVIPEIDLLVSKIGVHQKKVAVELYQTAQHYIEVKQKELNEMFK